MIVDALCAVLVVGIQMRGDQNLVARKGLPGKLQSDAVGFLIELNFPRTEGLDVLVEVSATGFAVKIFGCHELIIRVCSQAVDTAHILPPVFVNGFLLLHAVADASPHGGWGLLVFGDIKNRCHAVTRLLKRPHRCRHTAC